jgi:TRAP-type C4-dicarboxylate transport system permease small subunit
MDWNALQRSLVVLQARLLRTWRDGIAALQRGWRDGVAALRRRGLPLRARLLAGLGEARSRLGRRLPPSWIALWSGAGVPPPRMRRLLEVWHRGECWVAVAAFAFIAGIMVLDVLGREAVGPLLRLVGLEPGATGIFASQKLSIFALVIGSFAGIGIATATGAHIVPTFASAWVPPHWQRAFERAADLLTGLFLLGVVWFGLVFVGSSFRTDLRAPVLDWPVWPIQLAIPLGFLSAAGRYFLYAAWPALRPEPVEFQE